MIYYLMEANLSSDSLCKLDLRNPISLNNDLQIDRGSCSCLYCLRKEELFLEKMVR